jgi:hypothetical protein
MAIDTTAHRVPGAVLPLVHLTAPPALSRLAP